LIDPIHDFREPGIPMDLDRAEEICRKMMEEKEMNRNGLHSKYFVLKPAGTSPYARASRMAMRQYVRSIRKDNPGLAEDLSQWIAQVAEITELRPPRYNSSVPLPKGMEKKDET
jgi:hypothetical protein